MSGSALAFIITHGNLAEKLVDVSKILTTQSVKTITYSNAVQSLDDLNMEISEIIDREKPKNLVFFVDLMGGSCWMLVNRLKQKYPQARLIAGVNVPMLVSFYINYKNLKWDELINKILSDGKKAIIGR